MVLSSKISNLNILITGGSGQLGMCLRDSFANSEHQTLFYSKNEFDISSKNQIDFFINKCKPHVIVNAAAYTLVDKAEIEINQSKKINSDAPGYLAQACFKHNILLIHVSTDYVFDGHKVGHYSEKDNTNPNTVYGLTKLNGEKNIISSKCRYIIIRTSWVYSEYGSNFLKTMIELSKIKDSLKIVNDQFGNPTSAHNIAMVIKKFIDMEKDKNFSNELFHYCGESEMSWFGFATSIFLNLKNKNKKIPILVEPTSSEEFKSLALRPKNSKLSTKKIYNALCLKPSNFEEDIERVITAIFG